MRLPDYYVKNFLGIVTRFEDDDIKAGSASRSKNWSTHSDYIELRRGMTLMGTNVAGTGHVSGLKVGHNFDRTNVLLATYDRKIRYYDETASDWIETSTADILPQAALDAGDDICIDEYQSSAGAFFYAGSKNSSMYKIPISAPASAVDQESTDHRGKFRIKSSATYLWGNKDSLGSENSTDLFRSWLDKDELSDYDEVTAEAIGSVPGPTYTGTLAFKGGGSKRTCMFVSISGSVSAGTETFQDNRDGILTSNFGGTGTINYGTGDYSVTFSDITTSSVTAHYYWEDSTVEGILDFAFDIPRDPGQGVIIPQAGGGGEFQNMFSLAGTEYCLHRSNTYTVTLAADDSSAQNTLWKAKIGLPYWRAGVETSAGIYYMDAIDPNNPQVMFLTFTSNGSQVVPKPVSKSLDLSGYIMDKAVMYEWGDFVILECRSADSAVNNAFFAYNKIFKVWDLHDFRARCFDNYNGTLVAGDSGSKNVFTLFSGLTDEDAEIPNEWVSNRDLIGAEGIKCFNIFKVKGLIDRDQEYDIYFAYDNGDFVKVYTISGQGDYVDSGTEVTVGAKTLGSALVGGAGVDLISAHPYEKEFRINTPRFEYLRVRFVANKVGYLRVSQYGAKDIRYKGNRISSQYSVNT